ncbi:hypothetical protein ONZ45_g16214 [Pleurotus djamor]|nr:hypothetical protein ONZ45_g16214 [Pleurotus djamor]
MPVPSSTNIHKPLTEAEADINGVFWTQSSDGTNELIRVKRCLICRKLVSLGQGKSFHAFETHQLGQKCQLAAAKQRAKSAQKSVTSFFKPAAKTAATRVATTRPSPPAQTSQPITSPLERINIDLIDSDDSFSQPSRSPSPQLGPHPSAESSMAPSYSLLDSESTASGSSTLTRAGAPSLTPLETRQDLSQHEPDLACKGLLFEFSDNSIYLSYPWHLHHYQQLSYHFTSVEAKGTRFRIRSNNCLNLTVAGKSVCPRCEELNTSEEVSHLRERAASQPSSGTNYRFYSFQQLCELLIKKNTQINDLKLQCMNLSRKASSLNGRLSDHQLMMSIIAEKDIPGLQRIIAVAIQQNRSPGEIIRRIKRARDGLYSVKSFTQQDMDIATMGLIAGGPKLAYALAHAFSLPSVRTIQANLKQHRVIASVGFPLLSEALHNLEGLATRTSTIGKRGYVLMVDECALEERPRFDSQRDAVLGLCREHCDIVDTTATSIETIREIELALDEDSVHRAREATVMSVAPFAASHYNPQPVIISGTCKTEQEQEHVRMLMIAIEAFKQSPHGGKAGNQLFSIATDGDSVRRRAVHILCMKHDLSPTSPLYPYIGVLPLMNLRCGDDDMVADIDYKHLLKRLATALRQKTGMLIGRSHITSNTMKQALCDTLNLDRPTVEALFDPRDHQNVPKTNRLLGSLYKLSQDVAYKAVITNRPIVLLGNLSHLVATFLRLNESNCAAFAVVRVTDIINPSGQSLPSISSDGLKNPKVTFTGQVLTLELSADHQGSWVWNGGFEIFRGKPGATTSQAEVTISDKVSKNLAVISFPALPGFLMEKVSNYYVPHFGHMSQPIVPAS